MERRGKLETEAETATGSFDQKNDDINLDLLDLMRKIIKDYTEKTVKIDNNINKLEEKLNNTEEQFKEDIKKTKKDTEIKLNNKIEETWKETNQDLSDKIDNSKLKTIETLGIFVALFTFVSVNVQIFTRVTHLKSAMWFTVLLMGSLGFFALIIHIIINKEKKYVSLILILSSFFIIFALYAVSNDEKLNIAENKKSIKIENQESSLEIKD